MILMTMAPLLGGCGQQNNYNRTPIVKTTSKKGGQVVALMNKLQNNGYRPQELLQLFNANKNQMTKKQHQQAATIIYRSAQNSSLYYNHFSEMLEGEMQYSLGNQKMANPLAHLTKLNNNLVTGFVHDTQNQLLTNTYIGNDIIYVEPDFSRLYTILKPYADKDLLSFLKVGKQQEKSPAVSYNSVDLQQANTNFNVEMNWYTQNNSSAFVEDDKSLLNKNFQIIMGTFSTNNYTSTQQTKYRPAVWTEMKNLSKQNTTNYLIKSNLQTFFKKNPTNKSTQTMRSYYQTKINSVLGSSKFKDDAGNSQNIISQQSTNTKANKAETKK